MEEEKAKCIYKKEYALLTNGNVILKNPQQLWQYMDEKIEQLIKTHGTSKEAETKIKILKEFLMMYKYDCKNSTYPEPVGYFKNEQEKQKFIENHILLEEMVLSIGNIYTSYHEQILKNKLPIPEFDIPKFIIDYNELYIRALNEYCVTLLGIDIPQVIKSNKEHENKKNDFYKIMEIRKAEYRGMLVELPFEIEDKTIIPKETLHAYGTTYILPALIDMALITNIKVKMLHECLAKIKELSESKKIKLTEEEKEICKAFNLKGKSKLFYGNETDIMHILYNMFTKYDVLEECEDNEIILTRMTLKGHKKCTLGTILHSRYAKNVMKEEYYELFKFLFDTKYLNIRNNIMHGLNTPFDYFCIQITSILLELLWDIGKHTIFKDNT